MPAEAPTVEQAPQTEVLKASPTLMLQVAHGEFDPTKTAGLDKTPTEISQHSYDALKANHDAVRKQQQEQQYMKIREQIKKDPTARGEPSPEQLRHLHFLAWAQTESVRVFAMIQQQESAPTNQEALKAAFAKVHIDIAKPPIADQFYSTAGKGHPGKFYTEFCTGNTNQKLVAALDEADIHILKDFLVDTLGSEDAYNALLATKQTQDAIHNKQTLTPGAATLSDSERRVVTFFKRGEDLLRGQQPVQQEPTKPTPQTEPKTTTETAPATQEVQIPTGLSPEQQKQYEDYASLQTSLLGAQIEAQKSKAPDRMLGVVNDLLHNYGTTRQLTQEQLDHDYLSRGNRGISDLAVFILNAKKQEDAKTTKQRKQIAEASRTIHLTERTLTNLQPTTEATPSQPLAGPEDIAVDAATLEKFARSSALESAAVYADSFDRAVAKLKENNGETEGGIVMLNDVPTIILSDLHSRRGSLAATLAGKVSLDGQPARPVYELLKEGKINIVCVGDAVHSEKMTAWDPRMAEIYQLDSDGAIRKDQHGNPLLTPIGQAERELTRVNEQVKQNLELQYWGNLYTPQIARLIAARATVSGTRQIDRNLKTLLDQLRVDKQRHGQPFQDDIMAADREFRRTLSDKLRQSPLIQQAEQKVATVRSINPLTQETLMRQEMIRTLGIMKMIMDLKARFPDSFHFLRGNHDDVMGVVSDQQKYADESRQTREWIKQQFGDEFLQKWATFAALLPVMARGKTANGEDFVISHTVPALSQDQGEELSADDITPESLKKRATKQLLKAFTWTDNRRPELAANITAATERIRQVMGLSPKVLWIIGHRPTETGRKYRKQEFGNATVVQINDSENRVIAIMPSSTQGGTFDPERDVHLFPAA